MATKALLPLFSLIVFLTSPCILLGETESFTNSIGMKMVRIDSGEFLMGSDASRDLWVEQPVHKVRISKPFYISETEVTIEQFRLFRAEFEGTQDFAPYVAGVTWNDARAFAFWLGEKEGKPYRLPTEAEWEYVARAGSENPDDQAKLVMNRPNSMGVKNMLAGVREWCLDWFGEYSQDEAVDPVGPAAGSTRVVRGGSLDLEERNFLQVDFSRPTSRLAIAPGFGVDISRTDRRDAEPGESQTEPGLIGVWFDEPDLTDPQEVSVITRTNNNWSNDPRGGGNWSATWRGYLEGPVTGDVTFDVEVTDGFVLSIDNEVVIDGWERGSSKSGTMSMVKGKKHPVVFSWVRDRGNFFRVHWSWEGKERSLVDDRALSYTPAEARMAQAEAKAQTIAGHHAIGIRLVQAPMPDSQPAQAEAAFARQGVKQNTELAVQGPDPRKPYFRKRYLLPTPLENSPNEAIDALGMHPSFRRHCHSPGLEVMPNGDVLMVIYTSYREYEPGVSLIAARLRHGAEQWDMPSRWFEFVGANDHTPLLWTDNEKVYFFWSNPKLEKGAFPFHWTTSQDSGATWTDVRFPHFVSAVGSHSRQPINTAFRDSKGTMYLSSDGSGGESLLWASKDNGESWYDTGGRTNGRHTSFAVLKGDRLLGMGGKNTHIDEFMPRSISEDGGASYTFSKTPFSRQGSNQRPTLLRLKSGRLFFAGDFVHLNTGSQPRGLDQLGSYAALSEDEGETWTIKKLIGAQPHERPDIAQRMKGPTLGYSVARQAPNGMIHLIATMNNPCLHFELNEAWILEGDPAERPDSELMSSQATTISEVESYRENYPDGSPKITWSGGISDDGRFLLDGTETWFYDDGSKQWETTYRLGNKVGMETYWAPEGHRVWSWEHLDDGSSVWRQWWPNGCKKAESSWRQFHADGPARLWDSTGKLVSEKTFSRGQLED